MHLLWLRRDQQSPRAATFSAMSTSGDISRIVHELNPRKVYCATRIIHFQVSRVQQLPPDVLFIQTRSSCHVLTPSLCDAWVKHVTRGPQFILVGYILCILHQAL